jgi:3-hydroxyisobutyrate dehydrogenase
MKKIGFIGLGIMGRGMATNLLKKGFPVTVWNRDKSKCEPLIALGAEMAEDLSSLAKSSEVVITMLYGDQSIEDVLLNQVIPSSRPGTTFIDMTTVTPAMSRRTVEKAKAQDCYFIDAPVMGSKEAAAAGQLLILASGTTELLDANRSILEAMSGEIIHVGPNGSSAWLKLANNQMVAVVMAAFGESLAFTEKAGIDRKVVIDMLVRTVVRLSQMKQQKILDRDWTTQFALDLMFKDVLHTLDAAKELGVPMPVLEAAKEQYKKASIDNNERVDFSVIVDKTASGALH